MKLGFTRTDVTTRDAGGQYARPAGPRAARGPHDRRTQAQQQERERFREQRGRRMPLVRGEVPKQHRVIPCRVERQDGLQHAHRGRHERGGDQQRRDRCTQRPPQPPRHHGGARGDAPQRHNPRCRHPVRRRKRLHHDNHGVVTQMRLNGAGLRKLLRVPDVMRKVRVQHQHSQHDRDKGDQAHPRRQHQRDARARPARGVRCGVAPVRGISRGISLGGRHDEPVHHIGGECPTGLNM